MGISEMWQTVESIQSWQGIVLVIALSAFLLIGYFLRNVKFDINKYQDHKRDILLEKARALCPHAYVHIEAGRILLEPAIESPAGTARWVCYRCHMIVSEELTKRGYERFRRNPDELIQRENELEDLLKKVYS